jgi:AcrR family transcriptional regulator
MATTEDEQDDEQDDRGGSDHAEDLHPAGRRLALFAFVRHSVYIESNMYRSAMPKLWSRTIETHRREVRDAILDTTAGLVGEHGLRSVTMSSIAERTGIGRATLYKYYPSVEAILLAWHQRQITGHLQYLAQVREQAGSPGERLAAVFAGYALIVRESRRHHGSDFAGFLHRDEQVAQAERQLRAMIRDVLIEGVEAGEVRSDVAPEELASYCLHALGAAGALRSKLAVDRLVRLVLDGLRA